MSIEIIKDLIKVEEVKGTEEVQTMVETEIYLNTNKQEIDSILWVEGRTEVLNTNIFKDKLLVNGRVKFNIVYRGLDEEKNLHTLEASEDFKEEIDIEGIAEGMECDIKASIDHIEYDLGENRIDLQALLNLNAKVEETKELEVVHEIQGDKGLQILEEDITYKEVYGRDISYANVKEEIVVADDKPPIEKVVRFSVHPRELQTLVAEDRLIVSAEANVSLIYLGDNKINYIRESIPFNHFVELPGVEKDSLGEVKLEVVEGLYEIMEDEMGDLRHIDLDINIRVEGKVYDYMTRPLVVDLYSTKEELNIEKEDITILENVDILSEEEDLKLELEVDALEVLDIKDDFNLIDYRILGDEIVVESLLSLELFYLNGRGEVRHYMDHFPFKSNIYYSGSDRDLELDVRAKLADLDYELTDQLSLKAIAKYDVYLNRERTIESIKEIEETGQVIDLSNRPSIIVYIVQKGDKLWDIAKRYKTTVEDILSSNNLDPAYEIQVGDKIIIEKFLDNDFENM